MIIGHGNKHVGPCDGMFDEWTHACVGGHGQKHASAITSILSHWLSSNACIRASVIFPSFGTFVMSAAGLNAPQRAPISMLAAHEWCNLPARLRKPMLAFFHACRWLHVCCSWSQYAQVTSMDLPVSVCYAATWRSSSSSWLLFHRGAGEGGTVFCAGLSFGSERH